MSRAFVSCLYFVTIGADALQVAVVVCAAVSLRNDVIDVIHWRDPGWPVVATQTRLAQMLVTLFNSALAHLPIVTITALRCCLACLTLAPVAASTAMLIAPTVGALVTIDSTADTKRTSWHLKTPTGTNIKRLHECIDAFD